MNDSHLFAAAKECMFKSDYTGNSRARVGCVVVYKGTILAKGWNTDKTHTTQARFNVHRFRDDGPKYYPNKLHAEISALNKIRYLDIDFSRIHVYIYRELRNGHIALARCCPSCLACIREMGISHIHYSTDGGFAHEVLTSEK